MPTSSLLRCALVTLLFAQCHRAGDERAGDERIHGAAMSEANDLDTDDVGAVRERYSTIDNASAGTMAMLKKALEHDPRERVRANAVTALDALPIMDLFGKGAFEQNRRDIRRALIRALDDDAAAVQARAGHALALHDLTDDKAREALRNHLPQLRAAVASPNERVADDALWTLRTMQVPLPLEVLLRSRSERFRETGIEQAGIAQDPAAMPLLVELALKDPVPNIRQRAIQVISERFHGPETEKLLAQLLGDADEQIAAEAATAVARAGATALAPDLRQIVARPTGKARLIAAIRALAKLKDAAAVPAIAARLNDEQPVAGETSLALNSLVGTSRTYEEWQAWAKQQGYLH